MANAMGSLMFDGMGDGSWRKQSQTAVSISESSLIDLDNKQRACVGQA
jgi:hypothetical protein